MIGSRYHTYAHFTRSNYHNSSYFNTYNGYFIPSYFVYFSLKFNFNKVIRVSTFKYLGELFTNAVDRVKLCKARNV